MQSGMYVALSAQVALQRRLDTVAQNIANQATAGYRADEMKFEAVLSRTAADSVAFSSPGESYISRQAGQLTKTENGLDVAVQGDGWLAVMTPAGVAYTRDGRMNISEAGELTTLNNYPVLDVGKAPLIVDPNAGPPTIARDGMIMQGGNQVGAIGLFRIDEKTPVTRYDNAAVIPQGPAEEILDFTANGVVQGFVEGSNVNPITELTRLIALSRAFDAASTAVEKSDKAMENSIRTLGEAS